MDHPRNQSETVLEEKGPMQREFELCAETLQACEAAELGGADRIELCAALSEGGVSPSRGFLKAALSTVKTPVHVLIRPRSGDFVFTENEFRAMCDDVEDAVGLGAAGIVVGLLTAGGAVDAEHLAQLVGGLVEESLAER